MADLHRSRDTLMLYGLPGNDRLEASYARAFRQLGWNVHHFDGSADANDLAWWLRTRVGHRVTRPSLRLRRWGARRRNDAIVEEVQRRRPGLVLLVNGAFIMPKTVRSMREAGSPVAVVHPDAPVPGTPNHRPEHLPVAREADACFLWSRKQVERLEGTGAQRSIYLPFAWDPEVSPHVTDPEDAGPDVVFVGGWDRHREAWLEPVAKHFELEIWGPDYWATRTRWGSPLRACWQGRVLRGREAAEAVAGADIGLNILRRQNLPDGTNMRTFEVAGAGGFQLATRTSGAMEIYPEGEAGAYFGSVEELLEKIAYYLEHAEERRALAGRAHEITAREHRYVHRAREILSTLRWA